MSRGNGAWGTVPRESIPEVLFELRQWRDDAEPRIAELERRAERAEEWERKIDRHFAALKAIGWAVGVFWTAAVAALGFWIAAH